MDRPTGIGGHDRAAGSSQNMAEEIRAQLRADHQDRERTAEDLAALHAESENAWRMSLLVLDELAGEVAAACRDLRCRYDVRSLFRRGWVFDIASGDLRSAPGFGAVGSGVRRLVTVLVKPDGSWQHIATWDGKPVKNSASLWWPAVESLQLDRARESVKPQIARRAQGHRYTWGHQRPYPSD